MKLIMKTQNKPIYKIWKITAGNKKKTNFSSDIGVVPPTMSAGLFVSGIRLIWWIGSIHHTGVVLSVPLVTCIPTKRHVSNTTQTVSISNTACCIGLKINLQTKQGIPLKASTMTGISVATLRFRVLKLDRSRLNPFGIFLDTRDILGPRSCYFILSYVFSTLLTRTILNDCILHSCL